MPARVVLLQLPSRNEVRAKNLFSVASCKMHWQKSGDYLCVKVDRYTKLKREGNESKYTGLYCNFEVFHMRGKQVSRCYFILLLWYSHQSPPPFFYSKFNPIG